MQTIELVHVRWGDGQRGPADALQAVLREHGWPWRVRCVNLADMTEPAACTSRTGVPSPDQHDAGWQALCVRLAAHWRRTRPDMVVLTAPRLQTALHGALADACPRAVLVTLMADLADAPGGGWIVPGLPNHHLVCGSSLATHQALRAGFAPSQVHRCAGLVLRPEFHQPVLHDRARERQRLGLHPGRATALVAFGAHGSTTMLDIARLLPHTQLILACGRNDTLASRLHALNPTVPQHVAGSGADLRQLLALADVYIGPPRAHSLAEAVHMGLPVLTVCNAWTSPQERANTDWVREHGLGLVGQDWRQARALLYLLMEALPTWKAATRCLPNRAAFEVPARLASILAQSQDVAAPGPRLLFPVAESDAGNMLDPEQCT